MSTSQAFTQSRDVNAGLSHTARPASRPVASSLSRHSSPDETVPSTESTQGRRRIGKKPRRYMITTLNPVQLDSSCFLDIIGATNHNIYDRAAPEAPRILRMIYTSTISGQHKFPPDTHGFLYFHPDAHNPLQSQIRFRVTRDRNPTRSFSSGHDLTYGSGFTWHIPLVIAAKNPKLRDLLVRDGLIDGMLLAELQAHLPSMDSHRLKRAMSVLDQPFVFDFTNRTLGFVVRVAGQVRRYHIFGPLTCYQGKGAFPVHEAGSALCRFERSTLPQHVGRRIVVMRLLKIVRSPKRRLDVPPTCNVNVPVEGELFARGQRVWYRDVGKPAKPGKGAEILRLLYDASDDGKQASGQSS